MQDENPLAAADIPMEEVEQPVASHKTAEIPSLADEPHALESVATVAVNEDESIDALFVPESALPNPQNITLWDYLAARLRGDVTYSVPVQTDTATGIGPEVVVAPENSTKVVGWLASNAPQVLLLTAGFWLAWLAQFLLEPSADRNTDSHKLIVIALYALAAIWAIVVYAWRNLLPMPKAAVQPQYDWQTPAFRPKIFAAGCLTFGLAFLVFHGGLFNAINVTLWLLTTLLFALAFVPQLPTYADFKRLNGNIFRWHRQFVVSDWTLLILFLLGVAAFFRFYRLAEVPSNMVSDHAEKLLDVFDINNGIPSIFFARNTGREPLQFYLISWFAQIFNTGYSFLSLKLSTAIPALISVLYMYLLGKELGGKRLGLFAGFLLAIGYWPNTVTRIALRHSLYLSSTVATLYYMVRGLKRGQIIDFIWAGISVGIGLNGYSPYRIVPVLLPLLVGIAALHSDFKGKRALMLKQLMILILFSVVSFLPVLTYMTERGHFEQVTSRSLTRLTLAERGTWDESPWQILGQNLWSSALMMAWSNGDIWAHSVPRRPALDWVMGGLFHLGAVLVFLRYLRQRQWTDLGLLIAIPILMLPSTLSLAFPGENPSLNRSSGAAAPVLLVTAIALDALYLVLAQFWAGGGRNKLRRWAVVAAILAATTFLNYDLIFRQYSENYTRNDWNYSQLGRFIANFNDNFHKPQNAFVVVYPYWVDIRLVAIESGNINYEPYVYPDRLQQTQANIGEKLFLVKPEDLASLDTLKALYPKGVATLQTGDSPGRDFWTFFTPE